MLCIDIHTVTQSVLFPRSAQNIADMTRMVLPAPSKVLARRIMDATEKRRDVFLAGPFMGRAFLPALFSHLRQGCRAGMNETNALALFGSAQEARNAGVEILAACPDGYAFIPMGDADTAFWQGFCRMLGMNEPGVMLIAVPEPGAHAEGLTEPGNGNCPGAMRMWRKILAKYTATGAPPSAFLLSDVPETLPRLRAVRQSTGALVTDSGMAALLGLLSHEDILARSFRQGVTLLTIGGQHLSAALAWHGKIYGLYEQHVPATGADNAFMEQALADLKEFRLGWLPDETVRAAGGHGSAFAALPPEAEGFPMTFVSGSGKELFAGHARVAEHKYGAYTGCLGLLFAYGAARDETEPAA
ncbi:MAG: hypothetical protein DELT_02684 [Desulfovibrio sp.]